MTASGVPVPRLEEGEVQAIISPGLTLCACYVVSNVYVLCQPCWDAIPHRKSFDICFKCMTQCEYLDWSDDES